MTETASRHAPPAAAAPEYDAFMSYSHAADDLLAPRLQAAVQGFAKPWWKRRALRVFRDQASLSANPHLWTSISEALRSSGWFILLLSREAAASEWVNREVEFWLEHGGGPNRILPVLTDGEFAWRDGNLDADVTTAAPPALYGAFAEEPRWVDLRFARSDEQLDLRHTGFRDAVADLAASIRGVPKDDLESEEVRRHRGAIRTAWTGAISLLILALIAVGSAIYATTQRAAAQEQAAIATGRGLGAQATLLASTELDTSLLLAAEAVHASDDPGGYAGLLSALNGARYLEEVHHEIATASLMEGSLDGSLIATVDTGAAAVTVWNTATWDPVAGPLALAPDNEVPTMQFSASGNRLIAADDDEVLVWEIPSGVRLAAMTGLSHPWAAISPDGRYLLAASDGASRVYVWDIDSGEVVGELDLGFRLIGGAERSAFSPDGTRLAFEGDGLSVVEFPSGDMIYEGGPPVERIAWSPSGRLLAAASSLGIEVFDTVTMTPVVRGLLPAGPAQPVIAGVAFNASDRRLAVRAAEGPATVFEWDEQFFATERAVLGIRPVAHGGVVWRDDGDLIVGDQVVSVWDLGQVTAMGTTVAVPGLVTDLEMADDGLLIAATDSGIFRIAEDGSGALLTPLGCSNFGLAGEVVVAGPCGGLNRDTMLEEWSIAGVGLDGVERWRVPTESPVFGIAVAPDGRSFLTTSGDGIERHDVESGASSGTGPNIDLGVRGPVEELEPWTVDAQWIDEELVVILGGDGHLQFIDPVSGAADELPGPFRGIARGPDAGHLYAVGDGLVVIDVANRNVERLGSVDAWQLAVSPDGATIAMLGDGLELMDSETGQALGPGLVGTRFGDTVVAWTPVGLVTAGADRYGSGRLTTLQSLVEWGPDGAAKGFADLSATSLIVRWDVDQAVLAETACRLAGRSLTEQEWDQHLPGVAYDPVC